MEGFEPPIHGTKNRCLTAWLHPNLCEQSRKREDFHQQQIIFLIRLRMMKIVHVASEFAPLAKAGGLGDVLLGLARATLEKGHDVTVIIPKYSFIDIDCQRVAEFHDLYDGKKTLTTFWKAHYQKIPLILVESDQNFFSSGHIYGEANDCDRFGYFSKQVAHYLKTASPDLVHLHDWHTALVALLYPEVKSVLTLHNMAYPGACDLATLQRIGLKENQVKALKYLDYYSILQGGLACAEKLVAVSPTYAQEILTPEFGAGFDSYLNEHKEKLTGILNGIDYTFWNPEQDGFLPAHYNLETLSEKKKVKTALQKRFGLLPGNKLLVAFVGRLVAQKGPLLIEAAIRKIAADGGQFILLGATGDPALREQFTQLKNSYANNPNVHIELIYDEALAHLIFAGSDMLIVPSLFEPCGLTQMIAMRYGTVPLVRRTGGLADTVFERKNGFNFGEPREEALFQALDRSFACWKNEPAKWRELIANGMNEYFIWTKAREAYLKLYSLSFNSLIM